MADPWNVAGVVLAGGKLLWQFGVFWNGATDAPEEARELKYTVDILLQSVKNVRNALLEAKHPNDIPKHNYKSITDLNNKAERDLYKLMKLLPSPADYASRLDMLWIHFSLRMSQDNVRDIFSGINLCRQALSLELQTLEVFKMERSRQHDFTTIQRAWDDVLGQANDVLSDRPFKVVDHDSRKWNNCLDTFVNSLEEGASTSEGRSVILHSQTPTPSPHKPHFPYPPRRKSHQSSASQAIKCQETRDSGVDIEDLTRATEETAIPKILGPSILPITLGKVDTCLREGKYYEAAEFQKRAIEYRLAGETPVPTELMCRDEMRLANIYRNLGARAFHLAEGVLLVVIERLETDELEQPGLKNSLLAELYHDLGRICLESSRPGRGSDHLTNAFDLMMEMSSTPPGLLQSVGTMLYRIYINTNKPEVAEALDDHTKKRCGFSLKTFAWCQERGFDTDTDTFAFDERDMRAESGESIRGLSPLHVAAKSANDEVLRHMLAVPGLDVEVKDASDGATPFLLACAEQDAVTARILLEHGARPDAEDNKHLNGLHLCQRGTGGVGVAKLLLSGPAVDVNATEGCQNTALHLAASMGNTKMVLLLLASGADPNNCGGARFTPLMAAVQSTMRSQDAKMEILKVLVDHGADASLKYSEGQTAADMANDSQVRKVLKGWARERQGVKPVRRFSTFSLRGKRTSTLEN